MAEEDIVGKTLIKIDVEGAEEKVWAGMKRTLVSHRPTIMLEYTPGAYTKKFLDELESYAPLRWINHAGEEEDITRGWLNRQTDWVMLALRP